MNKMISLAKIMFVGLAVYLSTGIIASMLSSFAFIFQRFSWASVGILVASVCISAALLVAVVQLLVLKRDKWANKLIAKDIDSDQPITTEATLTMAFRLVSVGVGLYCLRSFVLSVSQNINKLVVTMKYQHQEEGTSQIFTGAFSIDYVQPILLLALAVYLLCGAPHFVRWQVKKTMQLCDESKN